MKYKARLKFDADNLPSFNLEHKLCSLGGFHVFSRKQGEWVILAKKWREPKPRGELSEEIQQDLIKRCNRIVNVFLDPDAHEFTILSRLRTLANTLPGDQRKFVIEWAQRNVGDLQ